ncbi:MAG: fatty acyl-AMP ligase [Wenzhouxiangellaceae bacterium]
MNDKEFSQQAGLDGHKTLVERARWHAAHQGHKPFLLWLENGHIESGSYTFAEIDERARAMAVQLRATLNSRSNTSESTAAAALIVTQPGLDFVLAFLACLYAGIAAVPAYPLRRKESTGRLCAVIEDAGADLVLTDNDTWAGMAECPQVTERAAVINVSQVDAAMAEQWSDPGLDGDRVAFIQYTSGSTGRPKGVVVTHANLMANQRMIKQAMQHDETTVFVSWLPLFHDMGLIGNMLHPLFLGVRCILMPPLSFVANPIRWLQAISKYRGTTSGGPNFAYDLCVFRTTPEQRAALDLSSWRVAFNGAEPVRAATLERFATTFAAHGFDRKALFPCYGMAEATLIISGCDPQQSPATLTVDREALEQNQVVLRDAAETGADTLVSSGLACAGSTVRIVDPESATALADDQVGEVWVHGPHVASEYKNQQDLSQETFHAQVDDGDGYLRTGDLGFTHQGELFITGRIKDLIIVSGRNLYPQDIELCATTSHRATAFSLAAAFSIDVADEEALVVVIGLKQERGKSLPYAEIAAACRKNIIREYAVSIHDIVLVDERLPTTSSGKIQRRLCRKKYLGDQFQVLYSSARHQRELREPVAAGGGA